MISDAGFVRVYGSGDFGVTGLWFSVNGGLG